VTHGEARTSPRLSRSAVRFRHHAVHDDRDHTLGSARRGRCLAPRGPTAEVAHTAQLLRSAIALGRDRLGSGAGRGDVAGRDRGRCSARARACGERHGLGGTNELHFSRDDRRARKARDATRRRRGRSRRTRDRGRSGRARDRSRGPFGCERSPRVAGDPALLASRSPRSRGRVRARELRARDRVRDGAAARLFAPALVSLRRSSAPRARYAPLSQRDRSRRPERERDSRRSEGRGGLRGRGLDQREVREARSRSRAHDRVLSRLVARGRRWRLDRSRRAHRVLRSVGEGDRPAPSLSGGDRWDADRSRALSRDRRISPFGSRPRPCWSCLERPPRGRRCW
jgi:hypothetical protein